MSWVNTVCVYCKGGLETVTHLFVTCKELQPARDLLAWYAQRFFDMDIDTARELAMLNVVFSDRVGHNEGDRQFRHRVVAFNKVIWDMRYRIIFDSQVFIFNILRSRYLSAVKAFFSNIIGENE